MNNKETVFRKKYFVWIILSVVLLSTLLLQYDNVEFIPGYNGWVSSHGLAIMKKAELNNAFVGYACSFCQDGNQTAHYFDRYAFLFSSFMNFSISFFEGDIQNEVYVSRLLMNFIFLCTMLLSYLLVRSFEFDRLRSITIILLVFSGTFFIRYKDMVHFDQPALLALIFFMYRVRLYLIGRTSNYLMVVAAIVPLIGRGYSVVFLMLVWAGIDFVNIIKSRKGILQSLVRTKSFHCLVIGIASSISVIFYNTVVESISTGSDILETGILKSAQYRTGITEVTSQGFDLDVWLKFTENEIKRIAVGPIPFAFYQVSDNGRSSVPDYLGLIYLGFIVVGLVIGILRLKNRDWIKENKTSLLIMVLSGPAWIWPMKNLVAPHNYTTIYFVLFYIVLLMLVLMSIPKVYCKVISIIAIGFYIGSLITLRINYEESHSNLLFSHADFSSIRNVLGSYNGEVGLDGGIYAFTPHAPYALCYYIPDVCINETGESSPYLISKQREVRNYRNVTPQNDLVYLFRKE